MSSSQWLLSESAFTFDSSKKILLKSGLQLLTYFFSYRTRDFFEEMWPIGDHFPLSQNKNPNWEGISSTPCTAVSNSFCAAATLRWGGGHGALSQPCMHSSKGTEPSSTWVTSCLNGIARGNPGLKWSPCLALCSTILIIWCNYVIN